MSRDRAKAPSQRQLRVGEELRHALARILGHGGFGDPVLAGANVTVTEVRMSPDLRHATAFVVPLGGGDMARLVEALNRAAGFLRARLAEEVELRFLPRLVFEADLSFDQASRIEAVLARPTVARDLADGEGDEDGA